MKLWKAIGSLWLSRKLWMMISAVAVLWAVHERSVMLLYTFTFEPQVAAFQAITLATLTAIAAVVTAYMGIQGFARSTLTTVLQATQSAEYLHEKIEVDERVVQEFSERYKAEPTYRPLHTLPDYDDAPR